FLSQDLLAVYENADTYASTWRQVGNIFACSALIHFYLDGFIWKMRDAKVRADLGMQPAPVPAPTPAGGRAGEARHWAFVTVLVASSLALGASERWHWTEASQRAGMAANLSALIPNNGYAHFLRAVELRGQGNIEAARLHYEKAVALDTNYNFTLPVVGDLALAAGDTMAALRAYEKARQLDPRDAL